MLRNLLSQWGLYILNAGMLLGITPLLVHELGDVEFGLWVISGNAIAWLMVMDFGIGAAVLRFGSMIIKKGEDVYQEMNSLFNSSCAIFLVVGLVTLLISVCFGFFVPDSIVDSVLSREQFIYFSVSLGGALAFNFLGQTFSALLQAHQRFDLINMVKASALIFRIVAYAWLVLEGYGLIHLALVTLLSSLIATLALAFVSYRVFEWRFSLSAIDSLWMTKLFGYGWVMLAIIIADQLRFATDTFIVAAYTSLALVTVYGIGATLTTVFREVVGAMVPIFVPIFATPDQAQAISPKFLIVARIFSLAVWGVGLLLFICAAPFIAIWMGDYAQSTYVLYILMVGFLIASSQSLSFSLLYARAQHFPVMVISVADAVANLGLSLWLVQDYGVLGVAMGTTIPFVITYGFVFPVIVSRYTGVSLQGYIYNVLLVPFAFFAITVTCAVWGSSFWQPNGWGELFLLSAGLMALYILLAWAVAVGQDGRCFLREIMLKRVQHKEAV